MNGSEETNLMIGGNVTRTNRNLPVNRYPLRNLRSYSEKSQLDQILNDPELKELPVSKVNRMRSRRGESGRLPDAYDDILISAYRETEWRQRD
jgi:hypothetical protein